MNGEDKIMWSFDKENLKVLIFNTREEMGNRAGSDVAECIKNCFRKRKRLI